MWPKSFWYKVYEPIIRKAAGMGTASLKSDPDRYDHQYEHCDILVVGSGPSGISSALAAAKNGARVILAEDKARFGGSLLTDNVTIGNKNGDEWVEEAIADLKSMPNVIIRRSTVFGYYDHNFLTILERRTDHLGLKAVCGPRQCMHRVRAKRVVLAAGAFERPLVFAHNDIPGVMQASSVSTYINRFGVAPGRKLVLATNNDNAYRTALDWHNAGREVVAVVDSRTAPSGELVASVKALGISVFDGSGVIEAKGGKRVRSALVAALNTEGTQVVGPVQTVACDLIATSGGWSAAIHLSSHTGAKPVWDEKIVSFRPGESKQQERSVGSCNGTFGLAEGLIEGATAGAEAAKLEGFGDGVVKRPLPSVNQVVEQPQQALFLVPHTKPTSRAPSQFVDFQLDVSASSIELAVLEGFESVEHVKRYTALGFGTDQGKLGNINGMAILGQALKKPIEQIGTTTFRPAYTPVTFGVVAGEDIDEMFEPTRKTAIHDFHADRKAPFEIVGQWLRPWYFPEDNEDMLSAVSRECIAARSSLGIMDASTLGKIDVCGKDAVSFLEKIYTHDVAKMAIGQCAYGIMLGEDGMIKDDGVMARLGENHFYLTTTTGGAANVMSWLEQWLQTEWPHLDVYMTSLTDHLSTIALVGPNSRRVLQTLVNTDLSAEFFPFMRTCKSEIAGIAIDLYRVSFSGELAFEVNVNSNFALHLWNLLMKAGKDFGITPYGTETMHVLRAEKGFIIVGQDTDGSVNPLDAGLGWLISKEKDFLGKRSLERADSLRKDRKQLVGLLSVDNKSVIPEGAQLIEKKATSGPTPMYGHVSSSYYSPILGHPIALALVQSGRNRYGEKLLAVSSDAKAIEVSITKPIFYDLKGEQQRVE